MNDPFARQFGTWRGAVRLALAHGQVAAGMAAVRAPDPAAVRRLVFVCHGNICRSAYADAAARAAGFAVASFGLSTSTGNPAWPLVTARAAQRGIDLSAHRATEMADFVPLAGDYLQGMEVRHLHKLAADPRLADLPRGLLGQYAAPRIPHLHDPYKLDPAYMDVCLDRVTRAVAGLIKAYPAARSV